MLQECTHKLMEWFEINLININISKTKLVCFRNPLKVVVPNIPFFLHTSYCVGCHCSPIPYSETVKYLGIHFDSDLSWNSHLTIVCSKLRSVLCLLYKIKTFLPFGIRKLLAYSLGYSIVRYGITVFGQCSGLWHKKVNNILKSIVREVNNKPTTSDVNLFHALSMPTFESLFLESVILSHYWTKDFKTLRPNSRELRTVSRFLIPVYYTRYGKNLRSFYVPQIFNSLPSDFFNFTSKKKLKKALRHLLSTNEAL